MTVRDLKTLGACPSQRRLFKRLFPAGFRFTSRAHLIRAWRARLSLGWLYRRLYDVTASAFSSYSSGRYINLDQRRRFTALAAILKTNQLVWIPAHAPQPRAERLAFKTGFLLHSAVWYLDAAKRVQIRLTPRDLPTGGNA